MSDATEASSGAGSGEGPPVEYLFFGAPMGADHVLRTAMCEGFDAPSMQQFLLDDGTVPLTNNLFLADKSRLVQQLAAKGGAAVAPDSFVPPPGRILIVKTLLDGMALYRPDVPPTHEYYPQKRCLLERSGDERHNRWFVFDAPLLLPEYMVDFEYVQRQEVRCAVRCERALGERSRRARFRAGEGHARLQRVSNGVRQ